MRTSARSRSICTATFAVLATSGCSHAPAFDVMGSLFPAWLVCIALGILFAVAARWVLLRAHINLMFPVLVYPCLAAVFTLAVWLIFF
ncbi:MAG: YtcA family lipoprotein [Acidobacteriaceae bacterium]